MRKHNEACSKEEFIEKAKLIHGDKFEYIGDYINTHTKIDIKCNTCNTIFSQRANSHLKGTGCKKCQYNNLPQNNLKCTVEEFELKCKELHNDRYDYFQDYTGSRNKISIYCKIHNKIFTQYAYAHLNKNQGCLLCKSLSKGEDKIIKIFDSWGFEYIREKTFDDLLSNKGSKLRFDFYLPYLNLIVEYDGPQHFEPIKWFGGEEYYNNLVENDKIKEKYCKQHDIKLFRIKYNENIFKRLDSLFE